MKLNQWWCGKKHLGGGHNMQVSVEFLADTFIVDPCVTCERCGLEPPKAVEAAILDMVKAMHEHR